MSFSLSWRCFEPRSRFCQCTIQAARPAAERGHAPRGHSPRLQAHRAQQAQERLVIESDWPELSWPASPAPTPPRCAAAARVRRAEQLPSSPRVLRPATPSHPLPSSGRPRKPARRLPTRRNGARRFMTFGRRRCRIRRVQLTADACYCSGSASGSCCSMARRAWSRIRLPTTRVKTTLTTRPAITTPPAMSPIIASPSGLFRTSPLR